MCFFAPYKAIYGLRRSPKDWSRDRNSKIDYQKITTANGEVLTCVPVQHQDGVWKLVDKDEVVRGLAVMFVDDCYV